jgi:hypothetical protein
MNKAGFITALTMVMAEQVAQRVQRLGLGLYDGSKSYNQIPNKHHKHKRGKPKR